RLRSVRPLSRSPAPPSTTSSGWGPMASWARQADPQFEILLDRGPPARPSPSVASPVYLAKRYTGPSGSPHQRLRPRPLLDSFQPALIPSLLQPGCHREPVSCAPFRGLSPHARPPSLRAPSAWSAALAPREIQRRWLWPLVPPALLSPFRLTRVA